jgi:signal transduction histidine kinase
MNEFKYNIGIFLLLGSFAFSFLVAGIVQRYISTRLLNLVSTMQQVRKTGNYEKTVVDNGRDEISMLVNNFNILMQQMKENQQRKDEFISIASHELKTPLTSIKGYLELLKEIENKQPNKQFVLKGLDNVNKLEKLIRDLLDVSKIQSGQMVLEKKEFNIDSLLNETISNMQMVTSTHEIIRHDHLRDEKILGDKLRIEQVLTNLLSNAVKYSPNENKVIVSSKKVNGEVIIKVKDFGMGIPESEQENIFERFYRTKDMPVTISGFGLGLYICRSIIERHQGKIWVETEEKGSAFYFSLPLNNSGHDSGRKEALP